MFGTTQRRSTGPRPREEFNFCQFTVGRLLVLSPPHRLLFEMKAACNQVDFRGMDPTVCAVRSTEADSAPRWLARFIPLHPKLQQALDARRGNFPARVRSADPIALSWFCALSLFIIHNPSV
jgi:hypothetical protein